VLALLLLQGCLDTNKAPQQESAATTVTTEPPSAPRVKKDRPPREMPLTPSKLARSLGITPVTAENYPYIDGSTAALPLVQGIYRRMFTTAMFGKNKDVYLGLPQEVSKTVAAYERLIADEVDVIFVPDPSDDVKQLAVDAGVELEYIPIGADALVFITSGKNPVNAVTLEQLVNIYSDRTVTNWADLGGNDGQLIALIRNKDSGSHGQMENLVLRGKPVHSDFVEHNPRPVVFDMIRMLHEVDGYDRTVEKEAENNYTLGYTVFYYLRQQMREQERHYGARRMPFSLKTLALDGVMPTPETIASKEYKLAIGCFAVIRKDEPAGSPARKMVEWLVSDDGQRVVLEAGLGALKPIANPPAMRRP